MRSSNDRPNAAYVLTVGPQFEGQSKYIEGKFLLTARTYLSDASSFTLESTNAYVATSSELSTRHQGTLGRRKFNWSVMDDYWIYGLWSPRFMWDPFRYEQIGMTGAFYQHKSSVWNVVAYASPLAIPERGYPVQNKDGKISSPSPYNRPMPEKAALIGSNTADINYNINMPSYTEVLFRPNAAIRGRYGREQGYWVSGGYGYLPVHQVDVAVEASLGLNNGKINTEIYPRFPMHHVLTAETGYEGKFFSLWTSVTGEQPTTVKNNPNWISNSVGPALISSAGGELRWQDGLKLSSSYLFVLESNRGLAGPPLAKNFDLELPGRFMYRRALTLNGAWDRGSPTAYNMRWILDAENQSNLFSFDLMHRPAWKTKLYRYEKWSFGLGVDFIASATKKGAIGQFTGDDRIRGGVTYAF